MLRCNRVFLKELLQRWWWRVPDPFHSGPAQAFYRFLLKAPKVANETLSAQQCDRLFVQKETDATSLALLETAPPIVKR